MRQIYALIPFFSFSLLSKTSFAMLAKGAAKGTKVIPNIYQLPAPITKSKLARPNPFAANLLLSQPSLEGPKAPTVRYLLCILPSCLTLGKVDRAAGLYRPG